MFTFIQSWAFAVKPNNVAVHFFRLNFGETKKGEFTVRAIYSYKLYILERV